MKTYSKGLEFKNYKDREFGSKRNIPIGVKLKIWFGNVFNVIGLAFFLFGLPFSMVFISFSSLLGPSFGEDDPGTKGIIIESRATSASVNDVKVYEYTYRYHTMDGNSYTGLGYTTGNQKSVGDELMVLYKMDQPSASKAIDLRTSEFGGSVGLFVLIFPLIGLIMLILGTRNTLKQIFILQIGELAEGKFLYKEATNTQVNKQTVYELTFEFTASDNQIYKAIAKTHKYHRLEDEPFEKLVYDPDNPTNAVLLDALPRGLKEYFLKNM
ncbi:MAG: DUF3592 domain-containing protein [Bacteroidales bacterium]|nr:DUF3592 domain-containing protein [Bacteroidales bacterium]